MTCREGLMSPQTETKASVGFKAGVKEYKLTYYTPEYETKDTDILAAFRVTPQPGVPPEEAGAAVAAESSTGTWTTVWTDGLTSLDRYKGRCYHIEPVPGEETQFIAYVAYPLDLFEEGLTLGNSELHESPCVIAADTLTFKIEDLSFFERVTRIAFVNPKHLVMHN
ncbi:unnamed protein product [Microthlaspi erraticum]|uniref:Ribulose bisphosphate carboxylase large chain n=1 Tax=Microthlaspi erraticum TaxID=1685480 RepID=A0A6D2JYW9_9BRAS|nr:unnamed protein product [Microthlaspi erraticum]